MLPVHPRRGEGPGNCGPLVRFGRLPCGSQLDRPAGNLVGPLSHRQEQVSGVIAALGPAQPDRPSNLSASLLPSLGDDQRQLPEHKTWRGFDRNPAQQCLCIRAGCTLCEAPRGIAGPGAGAPGREQLAFCIQAGERERERERVQALQGIAGLTLSRQVPHRPGQHHPEQGPSSRDSHIDSWQPALSFHARWWNHRHGT